MKNLTKIFMAVVAGMFAFSCVTDTTVDSNPTFESEVGEVKTVLSVGIANSEELRTQLGGYANGKYPMYWSNGDQISVNGVESNSLVLEEGEKSVEAEFGFGESLSTPYCIAYPAAAAGEVKFEANQSHANNTTFGNNVAAMWGYSENGEGVTLQHLTGVLKIGVVANEAIGEKNLVYAQVSTIDRTPIAGDFEFDFAKGELGKATETSTSVISYSFGEGVALSTEPTYLHIAVPAGKYDELYVTLYDEDGGVMYATVKAGDSKPLAAGKVREFKANGVEQLITYAPNAEAFVVDSVDKLYTLAAGGVDKDILFVKDIDMADDEQGRTWAPIEAANYTGTVHGNGYSIKGLTAPLFGTTSASIRGLHLKDVTLNSNENGVVAGLVCKVLATDTVSPIVEHCSVSGTLTIDNKTLAPTTANLFTDINYAGVVGYACGATIDHCVSNVDITVTQVISSTCATESLLHLGGVVALIDEHTKASNEVVYTNVSNCTNNGTISMNDTTFPTGTTGKCCPRIAGVVSCSDDKNVEATISNCTNNGSITVQNLNSVTAKTAEIAGVLAYAQGITVSNSTNNESANISVSCEGNDIYVGGVAAYCLDGTWKTLTNNADIEVVSAAMTGNLFVSGAVAVPGTNDTNKPNFYNADGLVNHGAVTVNGYGETIYIGGLIARGMQGNISNSRNNGAVTVTTNAGDKAIYIELGGLEGQGQGDGDAGSLTDSVNNAPVKLDVDGCNNIKRLRVAGLSAYCHHYVNECENTENGDILITGSCTFTTNNNLVDNTTDSDYNIGGIAGYKAANTVGVANTVNRGDVQFSATVTSPEGVSPCIQVGGIAGRTHQPIVATNNNYGKVIVDGDTSASTTVLCIGGTVGITHSNTKDGHTNAGDIYVSGSHNQLYLGGCVGLNSTNKNAAGNFTALAVIKNATNSGNIFIGFKPTKSESGEASVEKVATSFANNLRVGGVIGNTDKYFTNLNNSGHIRVHAITTTNTYISGGVGVANTKDLGGVCSNVTNTGNVSFEGGNIAGSMNMSGCVGYLYGNTKTNHTFTNSGNITFNNADTDTTSKVYIGGVANYLQCPISDMTNSGKISLLGHTNDSLYIGGVFSNPNGYNRTRIVNNGEIYINGPVKTNDCFIGGLSYELQSGNNMVWDDCHNNGDINMTALCTIKRTLSIGGLIAKYSTADQHKIFKNCSNNGDITSYAKVCGGGNYAGLIGYLGATTAGIIISESFVNNGNITYAGSTDGADEVFVGGVVGYGNKFNNGTTFWSGNVVNKGKLTASGTSKGGRYMVGGIIANLRGDLGTSANLYNYGEIEVTGNAGAGAEHIGGIVGLNNGFPIHNATVECTISAIGRKSVGMIVGNERTDAIVAKKCKIGGVIDRGADGPYVDEFGTEHSSGWHTDKVTISADNFHNFIYSASVDASVATADECSYYVRPTEPAPAE